MDNDEYKAYKKFRTGFTFKEIRQSLWSYSEEPKDWGHVTRRTVLGKWHEIKLAMWERYKPDIYRTRKGEKQIDQEEDLW